MDKLAEFKRLLEQLPALREIAAADIEATKRSFADPLDIADIEEE